MPGSGKIRRPHTVDQPAGLNGNPPGEDEGLGGTVVPDLLLLELGGGVMILLRREVGDVLRGHRQAQGRTLREISASAAVSLGYLSEVERGEKEASSELLASICGALHLPMSQMLSDVSDRAAESEAVSALVTLPISGRSIAVERASAA